MDPPVQPGRRHCLGAGLNVGLSASLGWAAALVGPAFQSAQARSVSPPALLLAREWSDKEDPAPYLVSEKCDGVRALWDGQRLRFRGGGEVAAPPRWLAALPAQPLDGELWLGRGRFDELSGLVRRQSASESAWAAVRFMVFEQPGGSGSFAQRYQHLQQRLPAAAEGRAGVQLLPQRRVADAAALQQWLDAVLAQGGEGLVLHLASAPYLTGRQTVLAKFKPVHDAEAEVLGYLPGRGRLEGRVGALRVRNQRGQVFAIGSGLSEAQRDRPPAIGSTITYAWRGETGKGVPRFVSFVREREPGV